MKNIYRVLLIDDKPTVLENAKDLIKPTFKLLDEEWKIEIFALHVKIDGEDEKENFFISEETFIELGEISKKPFDLFLLDFGYRKQGSDILTMLKENYENDYSSFNLEKFLFNPKNLVEDGAKILNRKHNKTLFNSFQDNFINHKKNIYIYTYIPDDWSKYVQNSTIRENITKRIFPYAKNIELIDTRKELFNNSDFDYINSNNDKNSKKYYPYIISKFLEKIIHIEISKESIRISKFIKVRRTSKVIGLLVFFAAIIGAFSEFFGTLIVDSFKTGQILTGIVFILFVLCFILFGGRLLVFLLEKGLKNLLYDE